MGWLDRIDAWLLALHQQLVDLLQRTPVRLARWALTAHVVGWCVREAVAAEIRYLPLVFMLACTPVLWFLARTPWKSGLRKLFLLVDVAGMCFAFLNPDHSAAHLLLSVLTRMAIWSYLYFSSCRPPVPPRRREPRALPVGSGA